MENFSSSSSMNISRAASSNAAGTISGLKLEHCLSGLSLFGTAPQWHPHRLRAWLKMLLLSICFLSTLTPHGLFYCGTKIEGLNPSRVWMLEAVSQITAWNRHLAKSLQKIITCIFELKKVTEVKEGKILRRSKRNFQGASLSNWFLNHCLKAGNSDAQAKR